MDNQFRYNLDGFWSPAAMYLPGCQTTQGYRLVTVSNHSVNGRDESFRERVELTPLHINGVAGT